MTKNGPAKGQHGIGARGNGKLLFFHTNVAQMIRHSKERLFSKPSKNTEYRQQNGHWAATR